ncbi:hypothetical protein QNI16_29275 [Cytophagaceae bacterium YF14B1]|uniref:Uncharacterized protein n=1 Tax=Xanthocytophaga flava TaxID=3048013 RepID=A0AAE3QTG5_9BACT|nr:hypothetical protein [Xanthocytophaga flavus]MDJ1484626.1 hypothetical protein [Xanthocytophaga flavus]
MAKLAAFGFGDTYFSQKPQMALFVTSFLQKDREEEYSFLGTKREFTAKKFLHGINRNTYINL